MKYVLIAFAAIIRHRLEQPIRLKVRENLDVKHWRDPFSSLLNQLRSEQLISKRELDEFRISYSFWSNILHWNK